MKQLLDAAFPPPRFLSGQPWAGYLASPTTYHAWARSQLAAARDAGGLLPVYVAPLTSAQYSHRNAGRDAASAIGQVHAIPGGVDRLVVCLDTEARAYAASPRGSVDYAAAFTHTVHVAGGVTVHYGPATFLEHLAPHVTIGPSSALAWLAWYTSSTGWPRSLAPWAHAPTAWQYRNNVRAQGTTVDVSRMADTFPLCRHPRPKTAPASPAPSTPAPHHDPADIDLAVAFNRWRHAKGL